MEEFIMTLILWIVVVLTAVVLVLLVSALSEFAV